MQHCHYQAIWFDLDGTLFDTADDIINAVENVLTDFNLPHGDRHVLKKYVNYGARGLMAKAAGYDKEDSIVDTMMEHYAKHYSRALTVQCRWFSGMEKIIQELEAHRIPWGIVTNKAKQFTIPLVEELGLTHRIAALVCGDTTNEGKPSAKPLLYACTLSGHDPRKCLFVGDNSTDIIAGKAAEMDTVSCAYGYTPHGEHAEQWGADFVIHHPRELHPIIWR